MNNQITKKTNNVAKLRKNYENANNSPNKLKLIKTEINRRNKEISELVKEANKYKKYTKAASKIGAVARGRITRKYTNLLKAQKKAENQVEKARQNIQNLKNVRAGGKNKVDNRKRLANDREIVNKFLRVLATDTRPTIKQKYRIFTHLMKPDPEINFLSNAGDAGALANALGKRRMVCHLYGTDSKFVKAYIPGLRASLARLATTFFEMEEKELGNVNNKNSVMKIKRQYRKKFLNHFDFAGAHPCLEGSITGLTESIFAEGFKWNGYYGRPKKVIINGKERTVKANYNFNNKNDVAYFKEKLVGPTMIAYYDALNNDQKKVMANRNMKGRLRYMWNGLGKYELARAGDNKQGYRTVMKEIDGREGKKLREAFVEAYKTHGNVVPVPLNLQGEEMFNYMNKEEADMNKINKNDLE